MLDVFRGLKSLVKISHVHIDSPVFRLHYSLTVMLLSAFSLIVTTRQYVGNPIDCVHTKDIPEDVLNTYCWIHSTYTIKEAFKKKVGVSVPYPGVDNTRGKTDDRKTYGYYQWVCFCLFFQVRIHHSLAPSPPPPPHPTCSLPTLVPCTPRAPLGTVASIRPDGPLTIFRKFENYNIIYLDRFHVDLAVEYNIR